MKHDQIYSKKKHPKNGICQDNSQTKNVNELVTKGQTTLYRSFAPKKTTFYLDEISAFYSMHTKKVIYLFLFLSLTILT